VARLKREQMFAYQERAAQFIVDHENCALFLEVGLGKTVSTLTAFLELRKCDPSLKLLVVAPLRIARKVWKDEIAAWAHLNHLTIATMVGASKQRLNALVKAADIHTINIENVKWLFDQFVQDKKQVRPWPWQMVVLDESQNFKSQSSQRWKAFKKLRRLFARCVALTGTPVPNGYNDLWSQFYLLDGGSRLGATETAFHERWYFPIKFPTHTDWRIRKGAEKEIEAAIADITLTMRAKDYLELPPVPPNPIRVTLPPHAKKLYDQLERHSLIETFCGNTVKAVNQAALAGKLIQLANGAIYVAEDQYEEIHDAKIDALLKLIHSLDGKGIICYSHRHDLLRIEDALTSARVNYATFENDEIQDRWNAGKIDYLLLHPRSCGPGLNLQFSGAENVIWFGLTYNLEHYEQTVGRLAGGLRRQGRNVVVHHIIADDTIDETLMRVLTKKGVTQDDLKAALVERIAL
jgi:SNF2 family DNA or RNA helicase